MDVDRPSDRKESDPLDRSETSMGCYGPQYPGVRVAGGVGHHLGARTPSLCRAPRGVVSETKALLLCWSGAGPRVGGKVYSVGEEEILREFDSPS
jgi:hypothetical protein